MASGGAYVAVHAGFFDGIESSWAGRAWQQGVESLSGSSAGALVGTTQALRVPARNVVEDILKGGVEGSMYWGRLFLVYTGLKSSMYDGDRYVRRLDTLCRNRMGPQKPMSIALTTDQLAQRTITYTSDEGLLNAAVASASIPYVMQARDVAPLGMCADGGIQGSSFAEDVVIRRLKESSGTLVLLNCMPWPGHRGSPATVSMASIASLISNERYMHGMENISRLIVPPVQFTDGIFEVRVDNRTGVPRQSAGGNLRVLFVAPTHESFMRCGGLQTMAKLTYGKNDAHIVAMVGAGRQMARTFMQLY